MNVVDSSAWLSYFAGDANAGVFSKPIEAIDQLIAESDSPIDIYLDMQ